MHSITGHDIKTPAGMLLPLGNAILGNTVRDGMRFSLRQYPMRQCSCALTSSLCRVAKMHVFCCWQLFRFCIECVGIEDVVEYFRLEIFYGFVVCVVAVGSVCIVVVLLFCILQVVLVDSRIT